MHPVLKCSLYLTNTATIHWLVSIPYWINTDLKINIPCPRPLSVAWDYGFVLGLLNNNILCRHKTLYIMLEKRWNVYQKSTKDCRHGNRNSIDNQIQQKSTRHGDIIDKRLQQDMEIALTKDCSKTWRQHWQKTEAKHGDSIDNQIQICYNESIHIYKTSICPSKT